MKTLKINWHGMIMKAKISLASGIWNLKIWVPQSHFCIVLDSWSQRINDRPSREQIIPFTDFLNCNVKYNLSCTTLKPLRLWNYSKVNNSHWTKANANAKFFFDIRYCLIWTANFRNHLKVTSFSHSLSQSVNTSLKRLFAVCDPGYEGLLGNGTCTECSLGTYKPTLSNETCSPCNPGQITNSTGSTSSSDCGEYSATCFVRPLTVEPAF